MPGEGPPFTLGPGRALQSSEPALEGELGGGKGSINYLLGTLVPAFIFFYLDLFACFHFKR